jgi:mono/diheme cytochrome c family protein
MRHPFVPAVLVLTLGSAACRNDMHDQAKLRPFRKSAVWKDGSSARPLVPGTVPRGFLREDRAFFAGQGPDGKFLTELPASVTVSKDLLLRGQERFDVFCSPCHGRTGDGQGMIVQRGFKQPSSFHVERLRGERIGTFFDAMTNGFGQMSSYASQIPPEDRWAIAAYVRVLQLSRSAPSSMLSEADRKGLEIASAPAPKAAALDVHK